MQSYSSSTGHYLLGQIFSYERNFLLSQEPSCCAIALAHLQDIFQNFLCMIKRFDVHHLKLVFIFWCKIAPPAVLNGELSSTSACCNGEPLISCETQATSRGRRNNRATLDGRQRFHWWRDSCRQQITTRIAYRRLVGGPNETEIILRPRRTTTTTTLLPGYATDGGGRVSDDECSASAGEQTRSRAEQLKIDLEFLDEK